MKKNEKSTFFLLLITILVGFLNCKQKTEISKKESIAKSVFLFPEQTSDTILKSVLLDETNVEYTNKPFLLKSKKENLNLSFNLKTPRLFRFYSFEPMSNPFIIYVTPGDTLSYRLEKQVIVFKGTNAAHYNFFKELYDLKFEYIKYDEKLGVLDFKKIKKKEYQKKLDFLEQYVNNKQTSISFYKKIKEVLRFQYLSGIMNTNIFPKGTITNYTEYLEDITIELFKRNDQDDNLYFQLALTNYLKIITENNNNNNNSKEALEYQLDLINQNLKGKTKEYAITKMIFEFNNHLNIKDINYLKDKIKFYLPQINVEDYRVVINRIFNQINKINNSLSDEIFNSIVLDIDGNNITFKDVLNKQGDRIKIIDFWASWCAPCIKDIKESYLYRQRLIKEKNVEFLYFSIDEKQDNWRKKVSELKRFGMNKDQYLITDKNNAAIKTFFNFNTIPHYAILDNKNNVFLINSPSPSDTLELNAIIKKIDSLNIIQ
ncbi:TlpA family protein disulfide reductase [Lacinutrix sp. MEBiC02404]